MIFISYGGIAYLGSGHTITSCTAGDGQNGLIQYILDLVKIRDCIFPTDGTEFSGYNDADYISPVFYVSSEAHNQTANLYRAWTLGGITDSVTDIKPDGKDRSYRLTCESASYWGFYQKTIIVPPGETLRTTINIRRDTTTPTDGPDMTMHLASGIDPIMGGTPLWLGNMSEGVDTWEIVSPDDYENTNDYPVSVIIRSACKDASAQVWCVIEELGGGGRGGPLIGPGRLVR